MMTLKDWSDKHGILPTHPTTEHGAVSLIVGAGNAVQHIRVELFHLLDYVVSSACGIVIWLVPRKGTSEFYQQHWEGRDGEGI